MGGPVDVLDHHYLAITLLVTVGYQLLGFAIAWTFQFDKITDFTGGSNFFILALLTLLLGQEFSARNIITSVFVMIWASRLAGFLLFRVLKTGSDTRFDDIRSHFFKFLGFWIGQILWVWVVSLPLTVLNSPAVTNRGQPAFGTASDILGIIIWAIGWLIESIADVQKFQYKSSGAPKDRPIDVGLWAWSRHPPYFGEILCWWGIWTLSIAPSVHGAGSASTRSAYHDFASLRVGRAHRREARRAEVPQDVVPRRRSAGSGPGERGVGELPGVPRADVDSAAAPAGGVPGAAAVGEEDGAVGFADV